MRVGLNAQLLSLSASYRGAGIAHYIHQLLLHLPKVSNHDYVAFVGDRRVRVNGMQTVYSGLPTGSPAVRILWEQCILPLELHRWKADLLHAGAFVGPMLGRRPCVVTVYDASFVLFPESFRRFNRWYLTTMTRRSVQHADGVIAISENTRQDLIRLWNVPEDKISVAHPGVDAIFRPVQEAAANEFRAEQGALGRYILYVGTLEPRKNVVGLLEAFALLKQRGLPHSLVLAGSKGWLYRPIFEAVERLGLERDVRFPGFVPRDELPMWYGSAELFVYPSFYEGFGLSPLEAMACGTPAIVSDRGSLPEAVGKAAILVDPDNPQQLADAMWQALTTPALRQELRARGLVQAAKFTWEQTATATVRAYEAALARGGHHV